MSQPTSQNTNGHPREGIANAKCPTGQPGRHFSFPRNPISPGQTLELEQATRRHGDTATRRHAWTSHPRVRPLTHARAARGVHPLQNYRPPRPSPAVEEDDVSPAPFFYIDGPSARSRDSNASAVALHCSTSAFWDPVRPSTGQFCDRF